MLRLRAREEMPEMRPSPPGWPNAGHRNVTEYKAAAAAAATRAEHARRLAELPDRALIAMVADGWLPGGPMEADCG